MPGSNNSSPAGELDREAHWGDAQRSMVWRDNVARRTVCKALNIPLDDPLNIDQRRYGWGWKELLVVLLLSTLLGALWTIRRMPDAPGSAPPAAQPAISLPEHKDRDTARRFSIGPYVPPAGSNGRESTDH